MFKENKFNKIIYMTFGLLIAAIFILLILGEKSFPQVNSYEISGLQNGIVPATTQISITFNRVMDKGSVEKDFTISPETKGNFSWIGKKVVFTPKDKLQYGKEYKIYLTQAKDSTEKFLGKPFETSFSTKPSALFFISEDEDTKGQLLKVNTNDKSTETIIKDPIDAYSISPDGQNIAYSYPSDDENIDKIRLKSLVSNTEKELTIPKNLVSNSYDGIKVNKLLYGQQEVAILGQFYNKQDQTFISGRIIFLYELSTNEIKLFSPKDKVEDSDTLLFTPDYKSIIYRDQDQTYAYSPITNGDPIILGKYLSVTGFNFKQDKLAITDYDPLTIDGQYVAYVDKDRQEKIVSPAQGSSQEPMFGYTQNEVVYSKQEDLVDDFARYGLSIKNIDTDQEDLFYYDKNYSAELPQWSPDDRFVGFERYTPEQLKESLNDNRMIFNTAKPKYGQIVIVNTLDKSATVLAEKGRDITWDK